ncbi:hypothetical protein SANTM175S_05267 [Streptomyces antimycoticus]
MRSEGAVVSAEQLLEKAWDENTDPFTNVVRVTVMTLRRKLGEPAVIVTVPGSGYRDSDPAWRRLRPRCRPRHRPSPAGTPRAPRAPTPGCAPRSGYGSPCCTAGCS